MAKKPLANSGDLRDVDSIPGSRRSPRGGQGNTLIFIHLPSKSTFKSSSPPKDNCQGLLLFNTHHFFLHLREKRPPDGGLTSEMPKMFKNDPTSL